MCLSAWGNRPVLLDGAMMQAPGKSAFAGKFIQWKRGNIMSVQFEEHRKIFKLDTTHTTYMMGVTREGYLGHLYYGDRVEHFCGDEALRLAEYPGPAAREREKQAFLSVFPFEYPTGGVGDYRESCLDVRNAKGQSGCELWFDSYEIMEGKPGLEGLPASFGSKEEVTTLKVVMKDPVLKLVVDLFYSVFETEDVITRSVILRNEGGEPLTVDRVLSTALDMDDQGYEMLTLNGAWGRERHIQRRKIGYGKQSVGSIRGVSSPQDHPFFALLSPSADQKHGDVYAMDFVYSGNFLAETHKEHMGNVRMVMGIHPEGFSWILEPGVAFTAPEVAMTFSSQGLGKMTRSYHDFFRRHLIRSPYQDRDRPILINNWEGTYFHFDADKLLGIAKDAAACGIEMFVMDDGWFGKRDDDNCALGDWVVNEEKLSGGLKKLVDGVKALGMKFGIWFEPEMISEDSDLYRAHPDYAIQIPGRRPTLARNQLVLDFSRKEVRDTVYEMVYRVLKSADIDYVKWDMNRYLADLGSVSLDAEHQGELLHRYVLGLYEMQQRLLDDFPELLLENCSSGGARFDAGMLYYSPQIWTSDDTDAIERLRIQEGTELVYPMSTMGAHVSKCPNEQVGRNTPFETRANVALAGTFGYELNIAELPEEDRKRIPGQVARYHRFHSLIANGDYYRIHSWCEEEPWDCWENAEKDGSRALLTYVQVLGRPYTLSRNVKLEGLDAEAQYSVSKIQDGEETPVEGTFYGDVLMKYGLWMPVLGDYQSCLFAIERIADGK